MYVIQPKLALVVESNQNWKDAKPLADGFSLRKRFQRSLAHFEKNCTLFWKRKISGTRKTSSGEAQARARA